MSYWDWVSTGLPIGRFYSYKPPGNSAYWRQIGPAQQPHALTQKCAYPQFLFCHHWNKLCIEESPVEWNILAMVSVSVRTAQKALRKENRRPSFMFVLLGGVTWLPARLFSDRLSHFCRGLEICGSWILWTQGIGLSLNPVLPVQSSPILCCSHRTLPIY